MPGEGSRSDALPNAFGSFRVRDVIGEGRFGPVFRAYDADADRSVVVRTFSMVLEAEQRVALLDGLGRLCATPLDHPSIARPLAFGSDGDVPYLVHAYMPGTAQDELLAQEGEQPLRQVAAWVTQLAAAIDHAAAAGVHHGALGPRDVILSDDMAAVTGLGLSDVAVAAGLSISPQNPYASPQRLDGRAPTLADDVYSLAAVSFELVHGHTYWDAEPELPAEASKRVDSTRVHDAFSSALAAERAERPASASAFAAALEAAIVGSAPAATKVTAPTDGPMQPRLMLEPLDGAIGQLGDPPAEQWGAPILVAEAADSSSAQVPLSERLSDAAFRAGVEQTVERPSWEPRTLFEQTQDTPRPPAGMPSAILAVGAILGLAAAFGAGFLLGQGRSRAAAAPAAVAAAQPPQPATPAPAASTRESASTVSPVVAPAPRVSRAAPRAPSPAPRARVTGARAPTPDSRGGVAALGPGSVQILSRPEAANVYVDGRLVGRTPLMLSDVSVGEHDVRLELGNYRVWSTSVRVAAGERVRVAASLEQ